MHAPIKDRNHLGKEFFFLFLSTDFPAPKSGHRRKKQTVLGPVMDPDVSQFPYVKD